MDLGDAVMKISPIHDSQEVRFRRKVSKRSLYEPFFRRLQELKPGKSFTIYLTEGIDTATLHNRLGAARQRRPDIEPPTGCVFRQRTVEGGHVEICCEKVD